MASRSNPFPMGVSVPLPAGYVIWFGSLEFRATDNGYLMELLSPRRLRATGARASTRDKRTWSGVGQHATAPPRGLRLPCHGSASRPTGATASSSRASAPAAPAPSSTAALVPPGEGAIAPSPFPFEMRNATTYASSSSTNFTEYEDLPGHHLLSFRNLIASSPDDSYPRRRARSPMTSTSS